MSILCLWLVWQEKIVTWLLFLFLKECLKFEIVRGLFNTMRRISNCLNNWPDQSQYGGKSSDFKTKSFLVVIFSQTVIGGLTWLNALFFGHLKINMLMLSLSTIYFQLSIVFRDLNFQWKTV